MNTTNMNPAAGPIPSKVDAALALHAACRAHVEPEKRAGRRPNGEGRDHTQNEQDRDDDEPLETVINLFERSQVDSGGSERN